MDLDWPKCEQKDEGQPDPGTAGSPTRRGSDGPSAESPAFIAVPAILFLLDAISRLVHRKSTEFLVVPPLAVVAYLLFSGPAQSDTRLRAVVLLPVVASLVGEVGYRYLGLTPWGIAAVVLVVMAMQWALRARMAPALAIGVLAMLLRVEDPWYAADVGLATLFTWTAFFGWRLVRSRL